MGPSLGASQPGSRKPHQGLTGVCFVYTYCSLFFYGEGSVSYVPGRTQTHGVVQAGFELMILCSVSLVLGITGCALLH